MTYGDNGSGSDLIRSPTTLITRTFGDFIFDAVLRESHSLETEVTDNPLESGSVVADHAFDKPDSLTIEFAVSDVPLWADYNDQKDGGGLVPTTDPTRFCNGDTQRSVNAWETMRILKENHDLLDIQTGLQLYKNMMIVRVSADQDKDTSQVLIGKAELRSVKIVTTETVAVPPRSGKTKRQSDKKKNHGDKRDEEGEAKDVSKDSMAYGAFGKQVQSFVDTLDKWGL